MESTQQNMSQVGRSAAAMGEHGYMYTHLLAGGIQGCTDLDSSAGLNRPIVCSYAQTVQLKFSNVQSKQRNCAVNC